MTPYDMIKAHLGQAVPFANTVGVTLLDVGDGTASAQLEQSKATSNHIGTQHAGAMFTLAEQASGAALAGALATVILECRPVAKDAQISYVKIAKGTLTAHAKTSRAGADILAELLETGKTVFAVDVDVQDANADTVVSMTINWHVTKPA
jgi:uncharacterized protein (TIGR00369 family)